MSDYDSSLPIRTENAGDVDVLISDATTPSQKLKVYADGSIDTNATITATDLDIRDLVFATDKVDVSGSSVNILDENGDAFSSTNPLPVEFFESKAESFNHHKGDSIAKNATSTHTFSAPADFKLKDVYISGSGKLRAELKINSVIVAVGFNSTANPQVSWRFQKGLNASSVDIEVVIENLDNQAQDIYSTIVGIA